MARSGFHLSGCRHVAVMIACGLGLGLTITQSQGADIQSVEQFYQGKTVTLVIPTATGGINDLSGRLVAKHIGRFIPGQPAIAAQNRAGPGGVGMLNDFASDAPRDGSVIAIVQRAVPLLAIQGDPAAKFDPQAFTWLGSLSSFADDAYMLVVNATHPAKTVDDLRKPGISARIGTDVPGNTNLTFALIPKTAFGLNLTIADRYIGAAALSEAQRKNEIDGQVISLVSISANQSAMWTSKSVRPLIQFGRTTRHPQLPDVPTGRELTSDPKVLALLEFAELPFFMALPFVAPPGLPPERAAALRDAFMAMCKDPVFLDDARKAKLDISPIDGDAVRALLARSAATPKDVVADYNEISGLKK
jgi:tripartite-type tricarboxylate transporter receptor subunit TctC